MSVNMFWKAIGSIALATGGLWGVLSASPVSAASYTYYVWNFPGGPTAVLNCGWHNVCISDMDGDSLDWRSPFASEIRWRSQSSNSQSISVVGSVLVIDMSSGTCNTTWARLRSPLGTDLNAIKYLHTQPYGAGTVYYVPSGPYPVSGDFRVGTTVNNDCGTYPAHLHQGYTSTNWVRNSLYPTRAGCTADACQTYPSVWSNYQHQRVWTGSGY